MRGEALPLRKSVGVTGRVFLKISAMIQRSLNDYISYESFEKTRCRNEPGFYEKILTFYTYSINVEVFYMKKIVREKR